MNLLTIILVVLAVLLLPLVLFFSLVAMALFVWSWRRIGPYFVNLGRWLASWRNFIPLGCLGTAAIIGIVLFTMILPAELSLLRVLLLVLVGLVGFTIAVFALIVWTVRLVVWFWGRFRRVFWDYLERLWKSISGEGRARTRRPAGMDQRSRKQVAAKQGDTQSRPPVDVMPANGVMSSAKRSSLGLSWLWAFVWGGSQKVGRKPKALSPVAGADVLKQATSGTRPAAPPKVASSRKAVLRPLMWRLGLLGKTRQSGGKPKPAAPKGITETPRESATPVPLEASQPRPSVTAPAEEAAQAKPKPTIVLRPKPKRSTLGPIGRFGRSIGGALEGLRKGFWAGVFWVGRKARGGVDSILRVLHLGGKRR